MPGSLGLATHPGPAPAALTKVLPGKAPPLVVCDLKCRQIGRNVVLLTARGHVTSEAMRRELTVFRSILPELPVPAWIIDTSALGNFEPSAVAVGTDWFREFKAAGGQKVVFVSGMATARMAAGSIAFAARIPLVTCESLAQACDELGIAPPSSVERPVVASQRRLKRE